METSEEALELGLAALVENVVDVKLHVLVSVCLGYIHVATVGYQVVYEFLAPRVVGYGEGCADLFLNSQLALKNVLQSLTL